MNAKEESDSEDEEEDEKGDFHSPRQSFFTQQKLVRPSTEGDKGAKMIPRPASITSRLLSLVPLHPKRPSTISQSVAEETNVNDTLDSTLGMMALSGRGRGGERRGNSVETVGQLRRPKLENRSGIGK